MAMEKNRKYGFLSLLLVLLISLLATGCAKTTSSAKTTTEGSTANQNLDSSWDSVKNKGELVVGLCAQYPPFESRNEKSGEYEGFDVDLANAIGKELGIKVKHVDAAWEALLGGVQKGDYDVLITAMSKQEASKDNVSLSDSYYNLKEIIVVRSDDNGIKSVEDLKGKIVGVQTACSAEEAVDKLTGLKEVKRYNRNAEAFIDLRNKRVEAVVVGLAYATTEMKNNKDVKVINSPIGSNELVMVSKKGADALTAKLNEGLAKIKQNGAYDQAISKWLKVE